MNRYNLTDAEWVIIEMLLPNRPRGVPRVDDRRVINGIIWRFRTGCSWRDILPAYGPRTTLCIRFTRWGKAGVWQRIFGILSAGYEGDIVLVDSTAVQVRQHGVPSEMGAPRAALAAA